MFNIDFASLPEDQKKNLSEGEIQSLNGLFQDPIIQKQLEEIEEQRKIRQKYKYIIYGWCTLLALFLSFILGDGSNIFSKLWTWFFYAVWDWENSFSPVIWSTIISYSLGIGFLYKTFLSKIEIPLKKEVLQKICPLLYSKLEYSHDGKYSFNELDELRSGNFLSSYDKIDRVEDSTYFNIDKDGKTFYVNGFELETSEIRWSGKNRRRVTTNHCYLMRAYFPHARIPLNNELLITQDVADSWLWNKLVYPFLGFIFAISIWFPILSILIDIPSILFLIVVGLWIISWGTIHYFYQKNINTHRVTLENIEFEKLFDVKCADQITSRMIITPAFMDKIVAFVNKTGNQYEFLLRDNIMYIKRKINGTYLEAGTEKNMLTNLTGFTQFYTDMREIIQFVYDMNLMYLSKTDINAQIDNNNINNNVRPINLEFWSIWRWSGAWINTILQKLNIKFQ